MRLREISSRPMMMAQMAWWPSADTCHFLIAAFARYWLYLVTSSARISESFMSEEVRRRSTNSCSNRRAVLRISFRCLSAPWVDSCMFSKLTFSISRVQEIEHGKLNISWRAGRNGSTRSWKMIRNQTTICWKHFFHNHSPFQQLDPNRSRPSKGRGQQSFDWSEFTIYVYIYVCVFKIESN